MIHLDEIRRPIFTSRREQRHTRRAMAPMRQDATGIIIVCAAALIGAAILLLLASPWMTDLLVRSAGAEELPVYTVVLNDPDSALNVRTGAGREHRVLCMLANGAVVVVQDLSGGWALVNWPGMAGITQPMGWVSAEYLRRDSERCQGEGSLGGK